MRGLCINCGAEVANAQWATIKLEAKTIIGMACEECWPEVT
jgi:DNA-directed RNA polymerase subunit RPC12/RpoP